MSSGSISSKTAGFVIHGTAGGGRVRVDGDKVDWYSTSNPTVFPTLEKALEAVREVERAATEARARGEYPLGSWGDGITIERAVDFESTTTQTERKYISVEEPQPEGVTDLGYVLFGTGVQQPAQITGEEQRLDWTDETSTIFPTIDSALRAVEKFVTKHRFGFGPVTIKRAIEVTTTKTETKREYQAL